MVLKRFYEIWKELYFEVAAFCKDGELIYDFFSSHIEVIHFGVFATMHAVKCAIEIKLKLEAKTNVKKMYST